MPRLTEQQLVNSIEEFYKNHYQTVNNRPPSSADIDLMINRYITLKNITDVEDRETLKKALMIQNNAFSYVSSNYSSGQHENRGRSFDVILLPTWPYYCGGYGGYWHHHSHRGRGRSSDGNAALVILAIATVTSALAAAYGLAADLLEMSRELYNNQRVAANLAALAIIGAAVAGLAIVATALLISNPIGYGIVAVSVLVIGVALLIKGVRALTTAFDAALDKKSGLSSDSRFQLTAKEEAHLRSTMSASDEDVNKIKGIIRGLAVQAKSTPKTGFFGSNDRYLEIIKVLTNVKTGEISPQMKKQYGLERFGPEAPSAEREMPAAVV